MRPGAQGANSPQLKHAPRVLAALLVAGALICWGSGPARAQSIWVTPLFGVSEDYDTNVTLTPSATSDFVTTVKPGVAFQLKYFPFELTLAGDIRMMFYAKNPDLDTETDNIDASGTFIYAPTPTFKFLVTDTFIQNVNPNLVAPETGITTGRFVSSSNTVSPSLTYQFDPRTTGNLQYTLTTLNSSTQGAVNSTTQRAEVGVLHELTPRVSGGFRYIYTLFQESDSPNSDSHSPRLSLVTRLTQNIKISSDSGPIWIKQPDGSYQVSFATNSRYEQEFAQGNVSLGYIRDAGVGGFTGVISTTQSVAAAGIYRPTRTVTVGVDAGWFDTKSVSGSSLDTQSFNAGLKITYQILRWLTFEASYKYYKQNDMSGSNSLDRQVFSIGLTASDQFRLH